ncbi:hypothetical protein T07_10201 [Trichinella nelsoni]|uniref:Uncharacterized protein n=1 Tax=Trichinella nelsoni TaxID=6336 RepID=A0A0V0SG25_9BILA|nr:hypothetical protein T07_10201 [Trichinella nelsoni]
MSNKRKPNQVYGTESGKNEVKCIGDLLLLDVTLNFGALFAKIGMKLKNKDTFVANQNAHLEMVLQQMTERVLQVISQFMATQGRPPQWNYEEKRNV